MKRRLIIALLMLVLLPIVVVTALGIKLTREEHSVVQARLRQLSEGQLLQVRETLERHIAETELRLQKELFEEPPSTTGLRERVRQHPLVRQAIWWTALGQRIHPPFDGRISDEEAAFLQRSELIWEGDLPFQEPRGIARQQLMQRGLVPNSNTINVDMLAAQNDVGNEIALNASIGVRGQVAAQQIATNDNEEDIVVLNGPIELSGQVDVQLSVDNEDIVVMNVSDDMMQRELMQQANGAGEITIDPPRQRMGRPYQQGEDQQSEVPLLNGIVDSLKRVPVNNEAADVPISDGQVENTGWHVWYWGNGLHLLYWRRLADGGVLGFEIDSVRLMADLIALLPRDMSYAEGGLRRIRLADSRGRIIYQWGDYHPADGQLPMVAIDLSGPLSAWRLQYFTEPNYAVNPTRRLALTMSLGIGAIALVLSGLAVYLYRESMREYRDASQRVNFVNQVSHELKTPLTNIRMYAELLEAQMADEELGGNRYIGVIVTESQRLSRLITNVLTFGRQQRRSLTIKPSMAVIDESVEAVVDSFRPTFEAAGLAVHLDCDASEPFSFDRDAFEQVLGNLLSNVEKYGVSGGEVRISSGQRDGQIWVRVADAGPGIPKSKQQEIFKPFVRLSDKLTEGVAGTGIGLAISRELARLHGGDLVLVASERGAIFELTLGLNEEASS